MRFNGKVDTMFQFVDMLEIRRKKAIEIKCCLNCQFNAKVFFSEIDSDKSRDHDSLRFPKPYLDTLLLNSNQNPDVPFKYFQVKTRNQINNS